MMDRFVHPGRNAFALAAATLGLLAGAMSAGHAESAEPLAAEMPGNDATAASGPQFVPSEEAAFEEMFAHLAVDLPEQPLPAHAVDLSEIEPPLEQESAESLGRGVASYYGRRFAGRPTANGEIFDPRELTAAHRTLPFGSRVRVTNTANGRSVVVRINDRGPFIKGRHIDLSRRAAESIGLISRGHGTVELELVNS